MSDPANNGEALRVAFDIGGTFTDIIVTAGATLHRFKILTHPNSVGADVRACIDRVLTEHTTAQVAVLVHGTTVAANTVLELTGARTGLISTEGFRDELEIRRLARPGVYSVFWERTPPLVARRHRLEVPGRLAVDGTEASALDTQAVARAAHTLADAGVEALAISFIHAYANPEHEQRAYAIAREILPDAAICISSDVLPEVREYERTSTTALNAYLMPAVGRYINQLTAELGDYPAPLRVMQSNGGLMAASHAAAHPVNMIESGPAAGVLAAAALARALGLERVVSFDMGGTTAKGCLIENGAPVETAEGEVGAGINLANRVSSGAGYALRVPAFDIAEVGAGGGSIAWVDEGGALRVGPRSAGAEPGPAAYGAGGQEPTITDANVLLGFMNPHAIAGGTVPIDANAAAAAFAPLADKLDLLLQDTAYGVHQVANATMSRAIRAVTTERGRDPRDFALVAFGGSGAIHALTLAESLDIREVCIPLHPGLFSAVGLMLADLRYDFVQSAPVALEVMSEADLESLFAELIARAQREADFDIRDARIERLADLRYARQSSELTVPVSAPAAGDGVLKSLRHTFDQAHDQTYGYCQPQGSVSLVSVRLRVILPTPEFAFEELAASWRGQAQATEATGRTAYFGKHHGNCETAIISRAALAEGPRVGPLVIEEFDTTVVVPPGWQARLDAIANIRLERQS